MADTSSQQPKKPNHTNKSNPNILKRSTDIHVPMKAYIGKHDIVFLVLHRNDIYKIVLRYQVRNAKDVDSALVVHKTTVGCVNAVRI